MQEQHLKELKADVADSLFKRLNELPTRKKRIEALIQDAVANAFSSAVNQEKMHLVSEEEVRLLKAFRRFKVRCKKGQVFRWSTVPAEGVLITEETSLIVDPREG